jgi:hypothetical protein
VRLFISLSVANSRGLSVPVYELRQAQRTQVGVSLPGTLERWREEKRRSGALNKIPLDLVVLLLLSSLVEAFS